MKTFLQLVAFQFIILIGFVFGLQSQVSAYEIVETKWGYDGKIVPNQINPVFFLLQNNTPQEEDLTLQLEKVRNASKFGAKQIQPVYLTAGSERWVTFYVYFEQLYGSLQLTNGLKKRDTFNIPNQPGEPARVLLVDTGDQFRRSKAILPRFSEELFPPHLSGTDGLEAVYLDHTPRWGKERRAAFWHWINQGGRVHILKGSDDKYPQFTNELTPLNANLDQQYVGNGVVLKHSLKTNQLDKSHVEKINSVETAYLQTNQEIELERQNVNNNYYGGYAVQFNEQVIRELKEFVNPHHNWAVIYSASFVYLLLIFPGGYLVSRWKKNYWATYGTLLGGVVFFSVLFNMVGARGYGESTQINTVAIAKVLPDEEVDITQYSNAFVTNGDFYKLEYEGQGQVFTTGQENERVNGLIQNGVGASFNVDIPPFSSRPFVLRRQKKLPTPKIEIIRYNPEEGLSGLMLSSESETNLSQADIWAVHGNSLTSLKKGDDNQLVASGTRSLRKLFDQINNRHGYNSYNNRTQNENKLENKLYRNINQSLILRSLGIQSHEELEKNEIPRDRIYVFITQPFPESLNAINSQFTKQDGQILIAYELLLPESL